MKYTAKQISKILEINEWHSCTSYNEKDGNYFFNVNTIQIAEKEGAEYFGEFTGNVIEDKYEFRLYKE